MKKFYGLICFVLLLIGGQAKGSHILGGEITYKYLGSNGPADRPFRYQIRFVGYVDRVGDPNDPSNWGCGNLAANPLLAIYDGATNARIPRTTGSNQPNLVNWPLPSHGPNIQGECPINPYYGGVRPVIIKKPVGCVVPGLDQVSIAITDTTFIVELPFSASGYKIKYENCCRSNATTNISFGNPGPNDDPGNTWLAEIPSPIFNNSSPQFLEDAVPFFCRGDTTTIANNASDPDGDRLIYSFVTPFNSGFSQNPPATYTAPTFVTFNAGFSTTAPFGPDGYAFINPSTGLTKYYSNVNGNFAVAIEIQEYRTLSNGIEILIGSTRREFLILVKDCQPNDPPVINDPPIVGQGRIITITEGDSVKFDVSSNDTDTTTISVISDLISGTNGYTGSLAVAPTVRGIGLVTTKFRWRADCGLTKGQTRSYPVNVKYEDEGCPPKTSNAIYTIVVNPFKAPTIVGKDSVCNTSSSYTYSVAAGTGRKWKIEGGTIMTNDTLNTVTITIPGDSAKLWMVAKSGLGCKDSTFKKILRFGLLPITASSVSPFVCQDSLIRLNAVGGYSAVSWTPGTGLSSSTSRTPTALVGDTTKFYVTSNGPGGCQAKDSVTVKWIPRVANAGLDSIICSQGQRHLGTNQPTGYQYYSYQWSPASGVTSDTSFYTSVSVSNGSSTPVTATFVQTATHRESGCVGRDTVQLFVKPIPTIDLGVDTVTICSGAQTLLGVVDTSSATYQWVPSTGLTSPISDTTTASLVNDGQTVLYTKYVVQKTELVLVPLPGEPICSNEDSVWLRVNPLPEFQLATADSICSGFSTEIGTDFQAGFQYQWTPPAGLSNPDSSLTQVTWTNNTGQPVDSVYQLTVTNATTLCKTSKELVFRINPLPSVFAGLDSAICSGDTIQIGEVTETGFSYIWSPSLGISDTTTGNPLITLINPNTGGNSQTVQVKVIKSNNQTFCRNADSLQITIKPLPIVNAAPSDTMAVCSKANLQLGEFGLPNHVYAWTPDSALSAPNISNPVLTVNNPDQSTLYLLYTLQATNALTSCKNKDDVVVAINPLPLFPFAYADTAVCSRDTIRLGGLGDTRYAYAWSPNQLLSDSTVSNPFFTGISTGPGVLDLTYSLLVSNIETACQNTKLVNVHINPLPHANAGPDLEVCSKDTIQIGLPPEIGLRYMWSPGTGLSDSTISNPKLVLVNDGATPINLTYTLTVFDTLQTTRCDSSDQMVIIVKPLPVAMAAATDTVISCATVSFQLGIDGNNQLQYQWSPDAGLDFDTISNPVLTLNSGNEGNPDLYILHVVDPATTCRKSDSVYVKINSLPIVSTGTLDSLCSGDTIVLGPLSGPAESAYLWTPATGFVNPAVLNAQLTLVNPSQSVLVSPYQLLVTNPITGCRDSATIQIRVNPLPIVNAGVDTVVCSGLQVTVGVADTTDNYQFAWTPATGISDSVISNPTYTSTVLGDPRTDTLSITTTNALNGCKNKDQVLVLVNPLPVLPFAYSDTAVCTRDSIILGGPPVANYSYAWSPNQSISDSTNSAPVFTQINSSDTTQSYSFNLLVTNVVTGCLDNKTVQISLNPLPDANAGPDVEVCSRDSVQIGTPPVSGMRYQWSPATGLSNPQIANPKVSLDNPGSTALSVTYTLTVFDQNHPTLCDSSDQVVITVKPLPMAVAAATDTVKTCATVGIQLGINGEPNLQYNWTPPAGLNFDTISNPSLTINTGNEGNPSLYILTVSDPGTTCEKKDSVFIKVFNLPVVNVGSLDSLCSGDTITLGPSTGLIGPQYAWSPSTGLGTPSNFNSSLTLVNPGQSVVTSPYQLLVTNPVTGCKDSSTIQVRVNPLPIANAGLDTTVCSGSNAQLGIDGGTLGWSYTWLANPGLNFTNISNPLFNVIASAPRKDTLFLTVTNSITQCKSRDQVVVTTNPRPGPVTFGNYSPIVCPFTPNVPYSVSNPQAGQTFNWTASGGTITGGGNSSNINVTWGGPNQNAKVFVTPVNEFSCTGPKDSILIVLNQNLKPAKPFGDTTLCSFNKTGVIYSTVPTPGSNYTWKMVGASVDSNVTSTGQNIIDWVVNNGTVKVWIGQQSSTIDPNTGTPVQCYGVSDTLFVRINPSPDSTLNINGLANVCTNAGTVETLSLNGYNASQYGWTIIPDFPILTGQGSDSISVNWNLPGTFVVTVLETSEMGCIGKPINKTIRVNPVPTPGLASATDLNVCPNDLQKSYIALPSQGFPGSTFNWTIIGGTALTPTDAAILGVQWGSGGNYNLTLRETSAEGCSRDTIIPLKYDPSFVSLANVSLTEQDDSQVELKFIMGSQETNPSSISIWRKELNGSASSWAVIASEIPKNITSYIDAPGATNEKAYQYKISTTNACARAVESDVHNTILLTGISHEADEMAHLLWNPYQGWTAGVRSYDVLRKVDSESSFNTLDNGIPNGPSLEKEYMIAGDGFNQCFRVVANQNQGNEISRSNAVCLKFENQLVFFNLITPNGDEKNDSWMIKNLKLYPENELTIFDRWGRKVFSATNYAEDKLWKANDLNDGVYFYKFTVPNRSLEFNGWVQVVR